ncbi:MAG: glycosyltransferase family protein, partial [candidate division Zixibacteria bacterium]|nr:glycosyltransferase family protein [candidate division Zixibacteria bacterium]
MITAIIVQARMRSKRLPGKVLKTVLGKSLLEYQTERLRRVTLADKIIIATTTNTTDQPLVEFCQQHSLPCFRGSEEDVLGRYCGAAASHEVDVIVRVTADCPLIDPKVIDKVIRCYLDSQGSFDFVSNTLARTYPRGMDCEVFPALLLEEIEREATAPPDREHVTPFFYRHPDRYRLGNVTHESDQSRHRWTVDTHEDLELIT